LPRLEQEAQAQSADLPLRFVYWYESVMPERDFVTRMYPGSPGPLSFTGAFSGLNEISDKLLFVRDLEHESMQQSNGGPHPSSGGTYLMGRAWRKGQGGDAVGPEDESFGNHSSLDQYLATQIHAQSPTPLTDLRAGFANRTTGRGNSAKSVSIKDGRLRLRHQTPLSMYSELFPFVGNAQGPDQGAQVSQMLSDRRSVLDFVRGGLKRVSTKVSSSDREKLDAHLTSIREVEDRLSTIEEASQGGGASCDPLMEPDEIGNERVDLAQDAYIPMITQALSCDITRVAGGHFGSHTNLLKYDFVNSARRNGGNWHQSTHNAGNENYYNDVLQFRANQFKKLIQGLDSVQEGDQTLLDRTVVLWYTDIPYSHSSNDAFTMIAGGSHYFRHGQMIESGGTVNRALTSICEAMGHGIDQFGDPNYGSGTLPNSARV